MLHTCQINSRLHQNTINFSEFLSKGYKGLFSGKFSDGNRDWRAGFPQTSLTSLSLRRSHTHNHFSVTFWKPLSHASPFGMLSLAALCIILVLELLDQFENLDIDDFEDYLEIDLDLDIGEIEGLELDPELEGELWNNIQDILGLLNRLEDLQL